MTLHAIEPIPPSSTPPGAQANYERWSLVFFTRPGNSVMLHALTDQSSMIADAVEKAPENKFNTGSTSLEWFSRRIKNQRIANRKVRPRSGPLKCNL